MHTNSPRLVSGGLVGTARGPVMNNHWAKIARPNGHLEVNALKIQTVYRSFIARKRTLASFQAQIEALKRELHEKDEKILELRTQVEYHQAEEKLKENNQETIDDPVIVKVKNDGNAYKICYETEKEFTADELLTIITCLVQEVEKHTGTLSDQDQLQNAKVSEILSSLDVIKRRLACGGQGDPAFKSRKTTYRIFDSVDDDILNIGKFLNQDEHFEAYPSHVAVAAEPMFSPLLSNETLRNDCLSPTKSIWTPIPDPEKSTILSKSLSVDQPGLSASHSIESLSFYSFPSNLGQAGTVKPIGTKDQSQSQPLQPNAASLWKTADDVASNVSSLKISSPLGILEEYELESTKLRYLSFEKSTKAHFQCLVDKIVRTNDQPASLLLQQKVKNSPENIKNLIFESIMEHCLVLIRNRFGNFLMQRCLESGTQQQVKAIIQVMKGNVYSLSCDRFGCHVVQKAIDIVDSESKAELISELLPFIHETIVHRFACHVWQRIFEVKWDNRDPLNLMAYVTNTMKGYWQRIANDENGSLVVQCIFEHCADSDKSIVLSEILAAISEIAKGQWGNWVIQHILEHGNVGDRQFVFNTVLQNIYAMSIDQYASKVVEKALRTAPKWELSELINAVINQPPDSSRPYILDMMSNQYANYVVQHILNVVDPQQREMCIQLITPHLASLKGSKYGQRVSVLIERMIRSQSLSQTTWSATPTNTTSYTQPSQSLTTSFASPSNRFTYTFGSHLSSSS